MAFSPTSVTPSDPPASATARSPYGHWWITTAIMIGYTTVGLRVTIVNLAFPQSLFGWRCCPPPALSRPCGWDGSGGAPSEQYPGQTVNHPSGSISIKRQLGRSTCHWPPSHSMGRIMPDMSRRCATRVAFSVMPNGRKAKAWSSST